MQRRHTATIIISLVVLWTTSTAALGQLQFPDSHPTLRFQAPQSIAPQPTSARMIPAPAPRVYMADQSAEVNKIIRDGQVLEKARRWGDALSHYEDGIRKYPSDEKLQHRFDIARGHYDLRRRYSDRSFCERMIRLDNEQAIGLYDKVVSKISQHYFTSPDWRAVVLRGLTGFEIALTESDFIKQNKIARTEQQLKDFSLMLRRQVEAQRIGNLEEAERTVNYAADTAQRYLGIQRTAVILEFLCGATNGLDHYSSYLTPDQLSEIYSQIEGNFVGLGIELKTVEQMLTIIRVIPGSPAKESGLLAGDLILRVDGKRTEGLTTDQSANLLQGIAGSAAELLVKTGDQPARLLRVSRRRVEVPSIDNIAMIDPEGGVAYLRLSSFQKNTAEDLDKALWDLYHKGMRSLIIDLRGNPGGLLMTAVKVVDRFVDRGVIVSTRGRGANEDFTYTARDEGTWRVPLTVLIDGDSASAAEIFAGAIRDHNRGTIVGQRSYGKGSVQGIFPLPFSDSGVRLTTAKFYSPSGSPFSRIGVSPDMKVETVMRPIIEGGQATPAADSSDKDRTLVAAIDVARRKAVPLRANVQNRQPSAHRHQTYSTAQ